MSNNTKVTNPQFKGLELTFFSCEGSWICFASQSGTSISCKITVGGPTSKHVVCVEMHEKMSAVNKIPGGFNKKELKNKETEVFASTLIASVLQESIDPKFRSIVKAHVVVENYGKNTAIESLAITALSALFRYAGIPSILIAGEALSYNTSNKEWREPSQPNSALLVISCYQGVRGAFYSGPELPEQTISKGIVGAFQVLKEKLEFVCKLLPSTKCNWLVGPGEQHIFPYSPLEIAEIYCSDNGEEINKKKTAFLSLWQDKELGEVEWNSAVRQILQAYLGWQQKRLNPRKLDESEPISLQTNLTKHNSGCVVLKGGSITSCYYVASTDKEYQSVPDPLSADGPRKLMVQVDKIGYSSGAKGEIFEACLIRSALRTVMPEDKFAKISIISLESTYPLLLSAVPGAVQAAKMAGTKIISQIGVSCVGIVFSNTYARFILDTSIKEMELLTDAHCYFAATKQGIVTFLMLSRIPVSLSVCVEAMSYGFAHAVKTVEPVIERAITEEKKKNNYSIVFSKNNPKLQDMQSNLEKLEQEVGCKIKISSFTVTLEGPSPQQFVDKLMASLYAENPEERIVYAKAYKIDEKQIYFRMIDGAEGKIKLDPKMGQINAKSALALVNNKNRFTYRATL